MYTFFIVQFSFTSAGESKSLPRHDSKDRDGLSSPVSSRMGRSSVSPTTMLSGGGGESDGHVSLKWVSKCLKTDLLGQDFNKTTKTAGSVLSDQSHKGCEFVKQRGRWFGSRSLQGFFRVKNKMFTFITTSS